MREHLGPALTCLSKNALRFTATRHGLGTLFLEDGSTIAVEPDRNYEAWELAGPRGCHLVCTPSGEIAYWSAKKDLPL